MTRMLLLVIALAAAVSTCHTASAATHVVRPDGTGDFLTVAAALAAAAPGDEILVGAGTYVEPLEILMDGLTISALDGPGTAVLDGQLTHRILLVDGPYTLTLHGITFARGFSPGEGGFGSAILAWNGPLVTIEDCVFMDNVAGWDNGAIHARHSGTLVQCARSTFVRNEAGHNGGACGVMFGATLVLEACTFADNVTDGQAGALNAFNAGNLEVSDSVFLANTGSIGAVVVYAATATIVGNTFHANRAWTNAAVVYAAGATGTFQRNIVSATSPGHGLQISNAAAVHGCNLYHGNSGNNVEGAPYGPGDLVSDPLFCDADGGDVHLCADSPAVSGNNGCDDQIGAFGVGCPQCGVVPIAAVSWSEVKGVFK